LIAGHPATAANILLKQIITPGHFDTYAEMSGKRSIYKGHDVIPQPQPEVTVPQTRFAGYEAKRGAVEP
jgi:hypothetical protein